MKTVVLRAAVAAALSVAVPAATFAAEGSSEYHIVYDGGTLDTVKQGSDLKLTVVGDQIRLHHGRKEVLAIPASAVTEISYGQDVHRRVGAAVGVALVSFGIGLLLALAKSKKHFVGLTWEAAGQKGGMAFQADKNEYRGLLLTLEGVTGKKVVDTDALTVKN